MEDSNNQQVGSSVWLKKKVYDKIVDWGVISIIAAASIMFIDPISDKVVSIWNSPDAIAELEHAQQENHVHITETLKEIQGSIISINTELYKSNIPDRAFTLSIPNSGPLSESGTPDGVCIEGDTCTIRLRIRRVSDALDCKVVPNLTEWGFVNPRSDIYIGTSIVRTKSVKNLGSSYQDLDVLVNIPFGLEPNAFLVFESYYTDCPGTLPDSEPLSYESEPLLIDIKRD